MRQSFRLLLIVLLSLGALTTVFAQDPPPRPDGDGNRPPRPENGERPPRPGGGGEEQQVELGDDVLQVTLDISDVETFADALAAQVAAGDGAAIDDTFRNSGVVIDEAAGTYFAVNGVHPVNQGDYTSYYPKSIVEASLTDDTIVRAWSFDGIDEYEVDMEGLTFGPQEGVLYIGDEYNLIFALDLESGEILRIWDLSVLGVSTGADRGIEAITYDPVTGNFLVGVQDSREIITLDLGIEAGLPIQEVSRFSVPTSPSGLFAHSDGTLYVVTMQGSQVVYRYTMDGELLCAIDLPSELGMTRPDGIYITSDDANVYLADSQGPLFGGYSMYRIGWTDPCN
ncbi:MAG: hypothetical protein AAF125_06245 [Chloroflexota bacterium]